MPTLTVTQEQVLELVNQLPQEGQAQVLAKLLAKRGSFREDLARQMNDRLRILATGRGRNFDEMTEDQIDDFINDLVHEDRACQR